MKPIHALLALCCATSFNAFAADRLDLSTYSLSGNYLLDAEPGNGVSGLEASAITYSRDSNSLFFVGDEGTGVVEISLTGQTLSTMAFAGGSNLGWPTASSNRDAEGLTYIGNGQFVVVEERLQSAYQFSYAAGGSVNLALAPSVTLGAFAGNNGTEGISYDPRDGSFVSVKQQAPLDILAGGLNFQTGVSTMTQLFNPALVGVPTFSDVQTLSPIDRLVGTGAADNLLVLSLGSNELVEMSRAGVVMSRISLNGITTTQAIEGVTVDHLGNIYLAAEDSGTGNSRLFVLTSPVPEPETYAMLLAGLALMGAVARRRRAA